MVRHDESQAARPCSRLPRRGPIAAALILALSAASLHAGEWISWRGPFQSGFAPENAIVTDWSPDGTNVIWHLPFGGRSTPIVHGDRVFFSGPIGEGAGRQERVVCVSSPDTGSLLWENRFNVFHTDIVENRIGWSSVAVDPETGNVYCHGTGGELFCWDADGRLIWKWSMTESFGRISGYGGRLHTPIVDEDRVVISFLSSGWGSHAPGRHRYVAFDKRTGAVRWWSSPGGRPLDTTYAVPVTAVIGGKRLLIAPAADGNVYAMLARTGEKVWEYKLSKRGLNVSAVVDGTRVYVCHSEENHTTTQMGAVLCIDASGKGDLTGSPVWRVDGVTAGYASPAIANGRLYVVTNSATLMAFDAATGETRWEHSFGRVGKGSPVVTADGVIYVGEQNGTFAVLRDEGDKCVELSSHTFERPDKLVDEFFGSPAVCGGRVYFMTRYSTYCLGSPDAAVGRIEVSVAHEVEEPTVDPKPTVVRMIPGEITLKPGETVPFAFAMLDQGRQPIAPDDAITREAIASATWTVEDVAGTIDDKGVFTAATDSAWSAGVVRTTWPGVGAAVARVRVVPTLPIEESFDEMPIDATPAGWNGAGLRLSVVENEGGRMLRKNAAKARPSPPFMRLRTYVTPPIEGGYTTQCDMMSDLRDAGRRSYQADMGLINSRYRLIMLGADKKRGKKNELRIESWSPLPRVRKDVEVDWEPDVWYTVRFEVRLADGKALCRGKFWPHSEKEPDEWQIELTDPFPNTEGSAGLYAYSSGTTSKSDGPATYFDNFKVYVND